MKKIIILGSTGSIGTQAVDVIEAHPQLFTLAAVAAHSNWELAARQIQAHGTAFACMTDKSAAEKLQREVGETCTVFSGPEGLLKLIDECEADMVLTSLVGAAGIEPTLHAIKKGLDIALVQGNRLGCRRAGHDRGCTPRRPHSARR